jgi:pyruvate/2-oxoglutarate dehydrogenase complex dihydrolipoamide dehydrogenase (E3) component
LPGECLVATLDDGRAICCDAVLAAIGRQPNIEDLGLASAGVLAGADGIQVDTRCRTSRKHIFAAGDVTGRYQFTHMAEHMSKIAVTNAVLRWPRRLDERHVVWTTFCSPEVARLGGHTGGDRVYRFPFSKLDRAITDCEPVGEVKVRTDRAGRILGASIIGARAGEMIAEYALAMKNGVRIAQLAETIHSYPTYAMANRRAADAWHTRQLDSRALVWLGRLLGYRGRPGLRM